MSLLLVIGKSFIELSSPIIAHICFSFSSNFYTDKTYVKINDVLPTLLANIDAYFNKQALKQHQKGAGFMGQVEGPMMIAFGHGLPDGYGIGPNLPGCMGGCCWFCCCCQTPAGHQTAKIKSDFNKSIFPQKGKGLNR